MMVPIFFACLILAINGAFPPTHSLGSTEMQYAAFVQILHNSVIGTEDLVVSTFGAFGKDEVFVVRDIKYQVERNGGNDLPKEVLFDNFPWPNELGGVPADVLNRDDLWWSASGFLVPGKEDGTVALVEVSKSGPATTHVISNNIDPNQLWWYHRVAFKDMNGDGRQDALSSRAYQQSTDGDVKAEMVWFEQPATDALNSLWPEHVMYSGPDELFSLETLPVPGGGTRDVIISPEYFAEKLVVSWVEPGGSWTDPSTIQHIVVDNVLDERYFDCVLTDLNMDGNLDLLVSIKSDKNGKLIAYEIPADFRTDAWIRHDLATGFKPQNIVITEGNGAPGMTFVFYPMDQAHEIRNKPMILLTGDDDGSVYLFESLSDNDPMEWEYDMLVMFHDRGTVGTPAIKDIDNDGYAEIFIPAYTAGELYVYTFKPQ